MQFHSEWHSVWQQTEVCLRFKGGAFRKPKVLAPICDLYITHSAHPYPHPHPHPNANLSLFFLSLFVALKLELDMSELHLSNE